MLDDGPSKLYDALSTVLGLEDLVTAQEVLRQARLKRANALKDVTQRLKDVRARLAACGDPRARACVAALQQKTWDLDAAEEQVLSGTKPATSDDELGRLQRVAACQAPPPVTGAATAAALSAAATA